MKGPCMCGDTACRSCGPAQGFDPGYELVCDAMCELVGPMEDDACDAVCLLVRELGKFGQVANLLSILARHVKNSGSKEKLTADQIRKINEEMYAYKPCSKHGEWPDPDEGCVSCMVEMEAENARDAAEFFADERKGR